MNVWKIAALFGAGILVGCMAGGAPLTAQNNPRATGDTHPLSTGLPLILDRTDMRIGTSVHFTHVPNVSEVNDLKQVRSLAHVVLSLDAWPEDPTETSALSQVPEESDVIVVLQGYPPSRAAAAAWDYLPRSVRMVLLVDGPPPGPSMVDDLNAMRHLERVIAEMDEPARSGFERLQRPLSFRKVMG